jgi:hypothetical protein
MIRLACPSCAQKLAVEDASAGTVCKCPACDSKFRVPEAVEKDPVPSTSSRSQPPKRSSTRDSAPGQRDSAARNSGTGSGTRSGSRRDKAASAGGVGLDELEELDDDEIPLRRKTRKRRRETPGWVYTASAVGGVVLFGLVAAAIFFKPVAIVLIVIGLPIALLSRKWYLFGGVGAAYLLSGAILFLLHNTLLKPLQGPPPEGATAQVVDDYCARLLKASRELEADTWVEGEKPSAQVRGISALVQGAYKAGAVRVCVANPERTDDTGLPFPDLVVVLPSDNYERARVIAWYKAISIGKRKVSEPGEKYLYVDY